MTPTKRQRTWYRCTDCGQKVVDWGRTSHWQRHNPGIQCCPGHAAPRDQVEAMFVTLTGVVESEVAR